MNVLFCCSASVLVLLLTACGSRDPNPGRRSIVVSPYSLLSDHELNTRYLAILQELQTLNKEMETANKDRDFELVHAKAQVGLDKARTARRTASHLDSALLREKRMSAIDVIIGDLNRLAEITR
ncbi:MAG: hypothetical protein OSB65_03255 [Roseibacillus sp.]|nr:hypothetical protein [Roseibacillus sp.]|tara:strand:- start:82 stop:453 length:372 start_codon:yes stop_codon:yes gene_type:complete